MTDLANATLQAAAAQNVNPWSVGIFWMTWPDIDEVERGRSVRATCAHLIVVSIRRTPCGYAAQASGPQPRRSLAVIPSLRFWPTPQNRRATHRGCNSAHAVATSWLPAPRAAFDRNANR